MRKSLWIVLAALFVSIGAPNAHADLKSYIVNFVVTAGNVATPPTGSFVYDDTTDQFQSFTVSWDGLGPFDITPAANGGPGLNLLNPAEPSGCIAGNPRRVISACLRYPCAVAR